MAFEPLLAAALAVGIAEGVSILSHSEKQLKETSSNEYSNTDRGSEQSSSLTTLIVPSIMYGTIALPMSIVGGSPGPAILDLLHSSIHSNEIKTITSSRTATLSTTLVPGKLPRSKKQENSDLHVKNSHDQTNANATNGNSSILETNKETSIVDDSHDVKKTNKQNNDLSEIQLSVAAVKRFRDDNKRAIQAMKDARSKIKSGLPKERASISNKKNQNISNKLTENKLDRNIKKRNMENSHKVTMHDEIQNSTSTMTYMIHPKVQNLFHIISFSSSNHYLHNHSNQNILGPHYKVTNQYGTYTTPLTDILRRFRFLLVGTACITNAIAYYSTNDEFSSSFDHVEKSDLSSSPESIKHPNEIQSKKDCIESSPHWTIPSNSHVALRFMTKPCDNYNHKYRQISTFRSKGDSKVCNKQESISIHQDGKKFFTLPIIITDQQTSDSKTDNKQAEDLSNHPFYSLDLGCNKEYKLPMNSNWLIQPTHDNMESNKNKSQYEKSSKTSLPFLLCEADISIPIQTYLQNSVYYHFHQNKTGIKKNLEKDVTLTMEAVQVSTRLIDMIAHQKNIFSPINFHNTQHRMESSGNNVSVQDNIKLNTNKKYDGIVNVFIQSCRSYTDPYESMNRISIDSLAAVGSSLCQSVEHSYMNSLLEQSENEKTQDNEMKKKMDNEKNTSLDDRKESETPKEDETKNNIDTSYNDNIGTVPFFTRVGKSIRQNVTIILKTIPRTIFQARDNSKKVLYLFSNEVTLGWLKPYFESRGWKIVWFDIHKNREIINTTNFIESISPGAFSIICGPSDLSTIEHACSIYSQIEKRNESLHTSSPKQVNIFTLLEKESSKEMLNVLFSHTSKDDNPAVALHPVCIESYHNDAFDMVRELLISGKSIKEAQEMIDNAFI